MTHEWGWQGQALPDPGERGGGCHRPGAPRSARSYRVYCIYRYFLNRNQRAGRGALVWGPIGLAAAGPQPPAFPLDPNPGSPSTPCPWVHANPTRPPSPTQAPTALPLPGAHADPGRQVGAGQRPRCPRDGAATHWHAPGSQTASPWKTRPSAHGQGQGQPRSSHAGPKALRGAPSALCSCAAGRRRAACPIPKPAPRAPPVRTSPGTASQSLHLRQEVETQREPRIPLRGPAYSLASSAPLHPQLPGSGARPETMRVAGSCGPRAGQQPPEVLPAPASRDAAAGPAPSRSSSAGPLREPSRVLVPVHVRGVRGSQEGAQGASGPAGRWRRQCGSPRRGRAAGLGPLGAAGYNSSFPRAAARGNAGRSPGGRISHDEARIGN